MADLEDGLDFLERGVGMFFNVGRKFLGVELAPFPPACFRGERAVFGGGQIAINGTPRQSKPPDGLGFGAAALKEVHHPFPQVQRIGFHARKPVSPCPNVNVKCYSKISPSPPREGRGAGVGRRFAFPAFFCGKSIRVNPCPSVSKNNCKKPKAVCDVAGEGGSKRITTDNKTRL